MSDPAVKLTKEDALILQAGPFQGLEIGHNLWPDFQLVDGDGNELPGEAIDRLARLGLLDVVGCRKLAVAEGDDEREIPDVELRCDYDLSEAGRALLDALKEEGQAV